MLYFVTYLCLLSSLLLNIGLKCVEQELTKYATETLSISFTKITLKIDISIQFVFKAKRFETAMNTLQH